MPSVMESAAGPLALLVNATVAVTVLVLLAGAGAWLMRRRSAAVRHMVWVGAVSAAVLVPVIGVVVPWRWEGRTYTPPVSLTHEAADGESARVGSVPESGEAVSRPVEANSGGARPTAAEIVLGVWAAGMVVVLGRLLLGAGTLARLRRHTRYHPADARSQRLARRAGLAGPVPVGEVRGLRVPVTTGLVRPAVLLPEGSLGEWSTARLDAVLLHEFAHVRRLDVAAHLVGRFACAIHWFNPLVWSAARRASRESERACDDTVLRSGARASAYASHVLAIARGAAGWRVPSPAVGQGSELEGRLLAVLAADARRSPAPRRAAVLAMAGIVVVSAAAGTHAGIAAAMASPPEQGAAIELAAGGREALKAELMALLADEHSSVRSAAARSLGELRAEGAVPALTVALGDPVDDVREQAALALGAIESAAAVPALAQSLRTDRVRDVREAAAWALGETESVSGAVALSAALEAEPSSKLRAHIAAALGETGRDEAVPALGRALGDREERVRRAALDGLSAIGSAAAAELLLEALRSEDAHLRRSAARALGQEARN